MPHTQPPLTGKEILRKIEKYEENEKRRQRRHRNPLIRQLRETLDRRFLPDDTWKRKLNDRISWFGEEISEFLGSDLGKRILQTLKKNNDMIAFNEFTKRINLRIMLGGDGLRKITGYRKPQPILAVAAARSAIRAGQADPFKYLLEELIALIMKS